MDVWKRVLLGLSTVVLYGLFVYLDGSLLTGLSANGTSVQINSLELAPNAGGTVEITAKDVPDGPGLAAYDLSVEYDPQVLQVSEVKGGDSPFTNVLVTNVDNAAGIARLASLHTQTPAPVGNVVLARLDVSATGAPGTQSPLNITVTGLIDVDGVDLAATTTDGVVSIPNLPSAQTNPQVAPTPVPNVAPKDSSQSRPDPTVSVPPTLAPNPTPLPTLPIIGGQVGGGGAVPVLPAPETRVAPSVPEAPIVTDTLEASPAPRGIPAAPSPSTDTVAVPEAPPPLVAEPSTAVESPIQTEKAAELVEPEVGDGLAIWVWVLIGLAGITVLIWGGILYLHLRDRFLI